MTTDAQDLDRLDAARDAAIADSGLGRGFRLYQPLNAAFWVWAFLCVVGLFALWGELAGKSSYYGVAISLSVVIFLLYGGLLWWFVRSIDQYSAIPQKLAAAGFAWGGLAAPWLLARAANDALGSLYAKLLGPEWAHAWVPAASVWFSEEWSKAAGVVLLIALAPRIIRTAFDGFIAGAYTGLGFQIVENIVYGQRSTDRGFGLDQVSSTVNVALMRMADGLGSHVWFTAVFSAGLVYLLGRPNEPRRVGRGLLLMCSSMVIHFVWDAQSTIAGLFGSPLVSGVLTLFFFVGMPVISAGVALVVYRLTAPAERELVRQLLIPEVARGVITDAEATAAAGSWTDRRRYLRAGRGRPARKAVLNGVFDLVAELGRSTGRHSERLEFIRLEVQRARARIT